MKKFILYLLALITLVIFAGNVHAQDEAGKSAKLSVTPNSYGFNPTETPIKMSSEKDFALKKLVIKRVLERYGSPVAGTEDGFIAACKEHELNCYLLPSIMGIESGFGKHHIPGTYNGFGWGRGTIPFASWEESYMTIGKGLRENYINKGAVTIDQIGAIYCEGDTWPGKVKYFMAQFEAEEEKMALYFN